jgi:cyclophilin family peptidyl-prolyl cis-trans isomerase
VRASWLVVPVTAVALAGILAGCSGGDDDDAAATTEAVAASTDENGCRTTPPAAAADPATYDGAPPLTIDTSSSYTAVLETSCGTIEIALDPALAPQTVNNFVFLANEGFYDGLTFHRVVPGFVIQGGDPAGDGSGGPGYEFPDELPTDGYPPGSVAMANAGPDTNGSQFFIVTGDASALPNAYSRFGEVTEGLDVARRIESLAPADLDPGDPAAQIPTQTVWIDSVTIEEGSG